MVAVAFAHTYNANRKRCRDFTKNKICRLRDIFKQTVSRAHTFFTDTTRIFIRNYRIRATRRNRNFFFWYENIHGHGLLNVDDVYSNRNVRSANDLRQNDCKKKKRYWKSDFVRIVREIALGESTETVMRCGECGKLEFRETITNRILLNFFSSKFQTD